MICIMHGYLLEGSGSNLWTRSVVESLCRQGQTVHLFCQENHPDRYPFISRAIRYHIDGRAELFLDRPATLPGECIMHKAVLGDTLPVYVWDKYEEFSRVVPMVELTDPEIESYLERNVRALRKVVQTHGIRALHANHAVLMSVVAQRVGEEMGVPYVIMPHGSAIEYAVKKDERFLRYATSAFDSAQRIFVIGDEMRERVLNVFPDVPDIDRKLTKLHLGVDTAQFETIPRARRRANVTTLLESVASLPRGKTAEQTHRLRSGLKPGLDAASLASVLKQGTTYNGKAPDADLEQRLAAVDWDHDDTILFVGRLISAKGIQAIVAALPLILEKHPDTRVIVVGHGPLREPLEALVWALEHGDIDLTMQIVRRGRALEGDLEGDDAPTELSSLRFFFEELERTGHLTAYFDAARRHVRADRVIFTGYLTHRELRHLFPCCDVAVFPSVVREAGPLVFLEALASGCFPLGTYFAGMAASIDAVAAEVGEDIATHMKLSPDAEHTVMDIARNVPAALALGGSAKSALRAMAEDHYDWRSVSRKLSGELERIASQASIAVPVTAALAGHYDEGGRGCSR